MLLGLGAVCGLLGDRMLADDFARYVHALAQVQRTGAYVTVPSPTRPLAFIIGGATLALIGVVLLAPALVGAFARLGARLPLSARLAVRDAERHRHRTGPATSAIVVAVTGSVVLAFVLAGAFRADELRYPPQLPPNTLEVMRGEGGTSTMLDASRLAAAKLPAARRHPVAAALGPPPPAGSPPAGDPTFHDRGLFADQRPRDCPRAARSVECLYVESGRGGNVAIAAGDATTRLLAGDGFDEAARAALASGKTLVFSDRMLDAAGRVHISNANTPAVVRLPAHVVRNDRAYQALPSAIVSRATARAQGWGVRTSSVLVTYGQRATRDDVDAAVTAAIDTGAGAAMDERPDNRENLVLLLVALAAGFVVLVGVAISVALSAAEGRADLATLAAVGAAPSRLLMANQALLVGGLGCAIGVVLGTFIAFTARTTTGSPDFVVPWANLAATGIGVPLLAALVAAICTRSRLPLVRRAE